MSEETVENSEDIKAGKEEQKQEEASSPEEKSDVQRPFVIKNKKILLLGLVAVIVLVVIGVVGYSLTSSKKEEEEKVKKEKAAVEEASDLPMPPVSLELEEFLVNLNTPGKQSRFLKMTVVLELPSEKEKQAILPYIPRIRDSFQVYLRELREEDVKGSAALYRLREELMLRLSKVVYPLKVNDILFKEILTQ